MHIQYPHKVCGFHLFNRLLAVIARIVDKNINRSIFRKYLFCKFFRMVGICDIK